PRHTRRGADILFPPWHGTGDFACCRRVDPSRQQRARGRQGVPVIIGPALLFILILGVPDGVAVTLLVMMNAERWNIDWSVLPAIAYDTLTVFPLLAIPLFLLGGQLMSHGGLIRQLTSVCDMLIGRLQAHLGHVMVLASAVMGAITGSSV